MEICTMVSFSFHRLVQSSTIDLTPISEKLLGLKLLIFANHFIIQSKEHKS